ncbi:MAG TPA: hypothetical protein VFN68_09875 [Acidimicrobiales bacterium]|nr:hypothetical protein [Acidimicrobiales bacterium]
MRDLEDMLRRSGAAWPAISRPPRTPEQRDPTAPPPPPPGDGSRRVLNRPWLRLAVTVVVLPGVVLLALLVARHDPSRGLPTGRTGSVPVAGPPLLRGVPADTPAVQVAAGTAGSAPWSVWAGFSAGRLDLRVVTPAGTSTSSSDPARSASLVARTFGAAPGFPAVLVYGVTSAPAASVLMSAGGGRTTAPAYRPPALRGLSFYAATVPASTAAGSLTVVAEGADGTPLLRAAPTG